jgi:hypothetical protein
MPANGSKFKKPVTQQATIAETVSNSPDRAGQANASRAAPTDQRQKPKKRSAEAQHLSTESQTGPSELGEHASANEEEEASESEQQEEASESEQQEESDETEKPGSTERKRKQRKQHKSKKNKKAKKAHKRRGKKRARKASSSSGSSSSSSSSSSSNSSSEPESSSEQDTADEQTQELDDDAFRTRLVKVRKDIGRSYQITPWGGEESKLRAFLDSLKTTYMALSISEEKMKIHLTKTFINNFAIVSWLENTAPSMRTFADLESAMLTEYSIVDVKLELVRDLKRLRQGDKSPKDYGLDFNALVQRFRAHFPSGINDELLILAFKDGCEPSVFNKVDWSRAKTPREAATLVSSIKDAPRTPHHHNFPKRDDSGRKPKHQHKPYHRPNQPQPESATNTPADQGATSTQTSSGNPNWKSFPKPPDNRQPKVCFKCNKPGHLSYECRSGKGKGRRD